MSHHAEDDGVFAPAVHALSVEPLVDYSSPAHVSESILDIHSRDESRSREMNARPVLAPQLRQHLDDVLITATTTVPPSPLRAPPHRSCDAVHVNPQRCATVTAAAARRRAEDEASVPPLTTEGESWGHWGFRHLYNGLVMMMISLYNIAQLGLKQQPNDVKALACANEVYMSPPPRTVDLKKAEKATAADRSLP
ncbi:hypothetical protein LSCM4_00251 [Leishmania orientalis]|uniref:Uncharacterized protein n=1 Tax=Leishmania orientalis TaxID=2249476 RepID=A0A836KBK0_9TRYP|nr:hypothetical protein LSCM4_00251 [Leishmania orientalis]